jgi:alkylation response protein AidB-like acyl-CoA dehydrogenase
MTSYIDLPLSGLEAPLSEMEQMVQDNCHRFAEEVLRPAGPVMDELSAAQTVASDSPLWRVLEQAGELGLSVKALLDLEPQERSRLLLIAAEELAWGDGGLAGIRHWPVTWIWSTTAMANWAAGALPNLATAAIRWMLMAACRPLAVLTAGRIALLE